MTGRLGCGIRNAFSTVWPFGPHQTVALCRVTTPDATSCGDDAIAHIVLSHRLADGFDGGVEVVAIMVQGGGLDENGAIEVGEEIAGARLGAIDGEDAEVFGADRLYAIGDNAVGLLQAKGLRTFGGGTGPWHRNLLLVRG